MKRLIPYVFCMLGFPINSFTQQIIQDKAGHGVELLTSAADPVSILVDSNDHALVIRAAALLQKDLERVTGAKHRIVYNLPLNSTNIIIVGSVDKSTVINKLVTGKKISLSGINGIWEAYQLQTIASPFPGIKKALVISGNDRRGTAFGVFELSKQLGVSPWYWWADVPVIKKEKIYFKTDITVKDFPRIKYRGIFINDEAPALSGWTKVKFGGFNHLFYEKVFELILRLKANYLWPAMWGNAFYDDDKLNRQTADDFGIVIGTSHHEPLMRAHDEWRRYGQGKWNYDSNTVRLKEFWRGGMERASNEKIVSIGMRGDGDEPMSRETATALLERIVADQRVIIEEVTGKPADQTPQLWALYKEVQDYYDKGMRVPDDVTLLLCDDNWGNIRRLPKPGDKSRKGGYGIYYHFDYVGGPRNYKWINTNPIPRVWEQMHLAWEYNAREIWIVNVGDIKPMEFPISFFLDFAWNPSAIGADDIQNYTTNWAKQQFGNRYAQEIADIISKYSKYNGRRKPELLNEKTYSIYDFDELDRVTRDYVALRQRAIRIGEQLPAIYKDAYAQLVLHPVKAASNLQEMYTAVAMNHEHYRMKSSQTNLYAKAATQFYIQDSLISEWYNKKIAKGKWNHMMDQTHIGYTYWQQPERQVMPALNYLPPGPSVKIVSDPEVQKTLPNFPENPASSSFFEDAGVVSMAANHFSNSVAANEVVWKTLPDLGRTGDAITAFPVTHSRQDTSNLVAHLEYDVYVYDTAAVKLLTYFSPTLNFLNNPDGHLFAVSIDDETPRIISLNKSDNSVPVWGKWVADNIIIKVSDHHIVKPGRHVVKYWLIDPGIVLQKLVLDFGGLGKSYLGPPETKIRSKK